MNGTGFRRTPSYSSSQDLDLGVGSPQFTSSPPLYPPTKVLMDGFRGGLTEIDEESPVFGHLEDSRPRSSKAFSSNDSVAIHLLVETAKGDSAEYEILSFEEVDRLKKEYKLVSSRAEASRRKLFLESKVRDAARSLSRLSGDARKSRRSLASRRASNDTQARDGDEFAVQSRKCDDLAHELWKLDRRATEIQRRLLQHTAGILQMTHKGPSKKARGPQDPLPPNIPPGSPESIYTYSNSRNSVPAMEDGDEFDERSLYRTADRLGEFGEPRDRGSRGSVGGRRSHGRSDSQIAEFAQQTEAVISTERKLEDLNNRLRELIVQAKPQQNRSYAEPPVSQADGAAAAGSTLVAHLDYLEEGLGALDREQKELKELSAALDDVQGAEQAMEERLEDVNQRIYQSIINTETQEDLKPPPRLSGQSLREQVDYLEQGFSIIDNQLHSLEDSAQMSIGKLAGHQEKADKFETVVLGLWDIIQAGQEESRHREDQERGVGLDADDQINPNEPFSLQAFSSKVQWLCGRATRLEEQKDILRRQVEQQREMNQSSDSARDAKLAQITDEYEHMKVTLEHTSREAREAREELKNTMSKMDEEDALNSELEARTEEIERLEAALADLKDDAAITQAEAASKQEESSARINKLSADLAAATTAASDAQTHESEMQARLAQKDHEVASIQAEMRDLEGEVVRLQTEVTVARAELDGAYGTRAQRAAEVAANPAVQKEIDDLAARNMSLQQEISSLRSERESAGAGVPELQARVEALQRELSETIGEYESLTRASIEFEKEREGLESLIDGLRDRCESLEAQLSDEKVRWLGVKSPGVGSAPTNGNLGSATSPGGHPPETTGTTVLKNEFKKMMRDTRAANAKALRHSPTFAKFFLEKAEQDERRKLEALVRTLRREQSQSQSQSSSGSNGQNGQLGPGKSSLSQSMTVS
ncbi:MAG: hypothetical protein M1819_005535 [Sarea resinae]|nr:MAG: hypothetical protein M1819_005535 [Sarea resinae]